MRVLRLERTGWGRSWPSRGMSWGGQGPGIQLPAAWRCLSGPPRLGQDSWLGSQRTGSLSGSAGACCVTLREPLSSLVLGFPCTRRHSALRCPQPFRCPSTFIPTPSPWGRTMRSLAPPHSWGSWCWVPRRRTEVVLRWPGTQREVKESMATRGLCGPSTGPSQVLVPDAPWPEAGLLPGLALPAVPGPLCMPRGTGAFPARRY